MELAIWDSVWPRAGVTAGELYNQHLQEIRLAEEAGFDHYWLLEHHFIESCSTPSPNLLLAAASQLTSRIRLGAMINVLPFHNPVRLAEEIAMLDVLSGGRVDVGVGRGLNPDDFRSLGLDQKRSREMFEESLETMLGIWTQDTYEHDCEHFFVSKQAPLNPPLVQLPHPPLFMSAQSRESIEWAAARDIAWGQLDARTEECLRDKETYRSIQEAQGHEPTNRLFLTREVFLAETSEQARQQAYQYLTQYWQIWNRYTQFTNDGELPDSYDVWRQRAPELHQLTYDELIDQGMVFVGDPKSVAEQILQLREDLDPALLVCTVHLGDISHDLVSRSLRLFGAEVMPLLGA